MSLKYNIALSSVLSACLLAAGAAEARGDGRPEWLQRDSLTVTQLGTVPSWSVTGAVSAAKGSKLEKSFTQNVLNTLYGEIPGLTVMQGSGEPGADSPSLNARGYNTLETTDRSVLIIVDGFESTLDNLSVQEIESVYLLKDATAAALYGMRAANGVLYVTTKRGSIKPLEINFSAQVGFNTPFKTPKFVDSYTYATLYNEALENDGLSAGGAGGVSGRRQRVGHGAESAHAAAGFPAGDEKAESAHSKDPDVFPQRGFGHPETGAPGHRRAVPAGGRLFGGVL